MIGYLKGNVLDNLDNSYIIAVGGVGYEVHVYNPLEIGTEVSLYIYTDVKETSISLWGFKDKDLLKLFKAMLSVSGVGTKTGFFLVHSKSKEDIVLAIREKDAKSLKVKGIGPKTAQKIILELHSKVDSLGISTSASSPSVVYEYNADVLEALVSLGYLEKDSREVLEEIYKNESNKELETGDILKLALSML